MFKRLFFIFALVMATASTAGAQTQILVHGDSAGSHNILSGVALNASPAARTITLTLGAMPPGGQGSGFDKLRAFVFFTQSAASSVTALFSCSLDGTNFGSLTSRKITDGASALSIVTDTHLTGVDADLAIEYDTRGCAKVKILFGGAGAGVGDLVDIQAVSIGGRS
ncbi:hypothetical protein LCGC14_0424630 [marine sediment metagenome]|uniref:Uncharacterized protein n=1 Tax=marine sediment metagenome TaxID=412755 RepID=A0A0F9VBW0_9ZZZZ